MPALSWSVPTPAAAARDADARLEETAGLAMAIGVDVVEKVAFKLREPEAGAR